MPSARMTETRRCERRAPYRQPGQRFTMNKDRTCSRCNTRTATNRSGRPRCDECRVKSKHPCADCGAPVKFSSTVCNPCDGKRHSGANHPAWRGGRRKVSGYWVVLVQPEHPFASMRNEHGEVLEHRLVMAALIGRPLYSGEVVHHVDLSRDNNTPANLELMTPAEHSALHLELRRGSQ